MVSSELQPVRLGQFALPHPGRSGASQPHRNLAVEPGIGNVSARVVREFGFVPRPARSLSSQRASARANRTAPMYIGPVDPSAADIAASRCGHTLPASRRAATMARLVIGIMRFTGEATEAMTASAIPADSSQRPSRSRADVRTPRKQL